MTCHSTGPGVALTRYARLVSGLDVSQVSAEFHRLRRVAADAPAPAVNEVDNALWQTVQAVRHDLRVPYAARETMLARLLHARGQICSGEMTASAADVYAWRHVVPQCEAVAANLSTVLRQYASALSTSPEQMRLRFEQWRRQGGHYEDMHVDATLRGPDVELPRDGRTQRALRKAEWERWLARPLPVFLPGDIGEQAAVRLLRETEQPVRCTRRAVAGAGQEGQLLDFEDTWTGRWARVSIDRAMGFDSDHPSLSRRRRRQILIAADPPGAAAAMVQAWAYSAP